MGIIKKRVISLKRTAYIAGDLHSERQSLISYLTSKESPTEAAGVLYGVLLLLSDKEPKPPDVITTVKYCLEDARINGELGKLFQQKAGIIKRDYEWLTDDHKDVKYTLGSQTRYYNWDQERAIELLEAVNEFYLAADALTYIAARTPAALDTNVLAGIPRVIKRMDLNPERHLSRPPAPKLKEMMERSKSLPETEFVRADWRWRF